MANDGMASKRLLTPAQAAAILGVEEQTLAVWRTKHRYGLQYIKVGRLVRYRTEDLDAFIERRLRGNAK